MGASCPELDVVVPSESPASLSIPKCPADPTDVGPPELRQALRNKYDAGADTKTLARAANGVGLLRGQDEADAGKT
jgi:hypothetical protein